MRSQPKDGLVASTRWHAVPRLHLLLRHSIQRRGIGQHFLISTVEGWNQDLSFAKTPHEAILVHVTCYTASLYVIDFTCALDIGEAHGFKMGTEPVGADPWSRIAHGARSSCRIAARMAHPRKPEVGHPASRKPFVEPYLPAASVVFRRFSRATPLTVPRPVQAFHPRWLHSRLLCRRCC